MVYGVTATSTRTIGSMPSFQFLPIESLRGTSVVFPALSADIAAELRHVVLLLPDTTGIHRAVASFLESA